MRTRVHYMVDGEVALVDHGTETGYCPIIPRKNEEVWINGTGYYVRGVKYGINHDKCGNQPTTCVVSIYLESI